MKPVMIISSSVCFMIFVSWCFCSIRTDVFRNTNNMTPVRLDTTKLNKELKELIIGHQGGHVIFDRNEVDRRFVIVSSECFSSSGFAEAHFSDGTYVSAGIGGIISGGIRIDVSKATLTIHDDKISSFVVGHAGRFEIPVANGNPLR